MRKKLIIVGNGIGMALSPEHFDLAKVMPKVWKSGCITTGDRELIAGCIKGIEVEYGPTNESQLMGAQIAQFGHELITGVVEPENRGQWFTDPAITYPLAISKYVYSVAKKLNENSKNFQADKRFLEFSKTLISFLKDTDSHFATLNYDTLFYSAFNDGIEINGETVQLCKPQFWLTTLNDGYRTGTGFSKENFNRPPDRDFGFYLHLHGSPLFISDETKVKKLNRNELSEHTPRNAHHIVLSDGELKPLLITRSSVLAMYWKALEQAIDEAEEIILFGYGGFDRHLNHLIKTNFEKQIYVV
jgi:hypothetical protein